MLILGIGGWLHDGAAAILNNGGCAAAIEEDKLLRQKHLGGFPNQAIKACLEIAGALASDVEIVALARPLATGRDTHFHLHLKAQFPNARMVMVDHHTAHAAAAFFPSPFQESRVLTLDRYGDVRCGTVWRGEGHCLNLLDEYYSPDSPAELYSRVTELLGFKMDSEEHKVQWISATGKSHFKELFLKILTFENDGPVRLDHGYFDTARTTHGGIGKRFFTEAGIEPGQIQTGRVRADLAASIQVAVEEVALQMAGSGGNLCLGGGLSFNTLLVQRLEDSGAFDSVWVQPVAGNAGTAIGAALHVWHNVLSRKKRRAIPDLFLGPKYDHQTIKSVLDNCKLRFSYLCTERELVATAVSELAKGHIVAWFQGRMEFGPRALGNRSLLASPLNPYSTQNLNEYIKHREAFHKFAASVPIEVASDYFFTTENARSLATVSRVKPEHRKTFEAALLDGDRIRVHVVVKKDNRLFWELLQTQGNMTGLPVVYNTSFNLFGEPLVCDPRAAVRSFFSSGIDTMFIERFLIRK